MAERTYRCSNCLDQTLTRSYDVSHLSTTCEGCQEFSRFINEPIFDQFRAFEESPPDSLDWERLDRAEKFFVCDQLVREGREIEDFELR